VARKRKKQREAETGFGDEAAAPPASLDRQRLTPVDVQQKVFRLAFRGYNERDVDEFLDRTTEDLAALHEENKRLRERIAEGGGTSGGLEEAQRQAESIVRQAREHAARLVEDAEARAAAGTGAAPGGGPELPASFLLQERQFLQQMAALIQDHARRLKDEARRARAGAPEPAEAASVPQAEASPEASPAPQADAAGPTAAGFAAGSAAAVPTAAPEPPAEPPEPRAISVEPQAEPQEDASAPWGPVGRTPADAADEGPGDDHDPLLSAWESAFAGEGDPERVEEVALYPSEVRGGKDEEEGEPSLRELFWGDEG
jgi:DivIVA domain-containing protein